MKRMAFLLLILGLAGLSSCRPTEEVLLQRWMTDGDVVVQAIHDAKSRQGTWPERLPEFPESRLKSSKLQDWQYSRASLGAFELKAEEVLLEYMAEPRGGQLAGWYQRQKKGDLIYLRPPQSKAAERELEGASIGNQKSIPMH